MNEVPAKHALRTFSELPEENARQTDDFQVCHVHIEAFQLWVKFAGMRCSWSWISGH